MLSVPPTPDLLTTAQVADLTGKSVPTINRWADEGRIPVAHKLDGIRGARLFARADVDALIASTSEVTAS